MAAMHLCWRPPGSEIAWLFLDVLKVSRELAFQISEQIKAFGQNIRVSTVVIVGGTGSAVFLMDRFIFEKVLIMCA